MLSHSIVAAVIAAALFIASPARAQAPSAASTNMPSVPASTCVKPEYPGRLALTSDSRVKAFNRDYTTYRDCTNKYVDGTKKLANDAINAGNSAVDDFNKFAEDVKAQNEAAK
jgi:hypothetical protein